MMTTDPLDAANALPDPGTDPGAAQSAQALTQTLSWTQSKTMHWLLADGWMLQDPRELVRQLCHNLMDDGIPVCRSRMTIRFLHPQVIGISYTWSQEQDAVEVFEAQHGIQDTDIYLDSPYALLFEGKASAIRRRLDGEDPLLDFPILQDLKDAGATDYLAMPILFSDGRMSAITFASTQTGGFSDGNLRTLSDIMPILSRIIETHAMRHTSVTLLDTYLGHQTGRRVLNGQIKRGDGDLIDAVIWFCDLRNSTPLARELGQETFLALLNDFFGHMAESVLDNDGEVLRYIGDAVLAIFPLPANYNPNCHVSRGAADGAMRALRTALQRMEGWNSERAAANLDPVGFGIGLHVGKVMYGNIGAPARLEFSVIGSAANEAARLESLTKTLDVSAVVSDAFTALHNESWTDLGSHELRGLDRPMSVYTLA